MTLAKSSRVCGQGPGRSGSVLELPYCFLADWVESIFHAGNALPLGRHLFSLEIVSALLFPSSASDVLWQSSRSRYVPSLARALLPPASWAFPLPTAHLALF